MMAKLAAAGTGLYDIVVPDNSVMQAMVQQELLAPLRHENIPNLKNISAQFANTPSDPGNRYGAPFTWAFIGIFARKSAVKPLEETLGLIFDPAKQPGPFLLVDYPYTCINAALLYKGYTLGSTNLQELAEARELLIDVKKRSLGFADFVVCRNRVLAREAVLALVSNQDGAIGMKEDSETYFFVPREGADSWFNSLSIPLNAPHRDLAEKFINYLLDAKVAARNSGATQVSTPNQAALKFMDPATRTNVALFPSPEVMKTLQSSPPLNDQAKLYEELWVQIKSK